MSATNRTRRLKVGVSAGVFVAITAAVLLAARHNPVIREGNVQS